MSTLIRFLYTLLIAAAVVAFVGFGINSLYQPPKSPTYPYYSGNESNATWNKELDAYNKADKVYTKKDKSYQRNVAIVLAVLTAVIVVGGSRRLRKSGIIGEGIALGGIGTGIYSLIAGLISGNRAIRFVSVTITLIGVLLVAQAKFGDRKAHS